MGEIDAVCEQWLPLAWKLAARGPARDYDERLSDALYGLLVAARRCPRPEAPMAFFARYMQWEMLRGARRRNVLLGYRAKGDYPRLEYDLREERLCGAPPERDLLRRIQRREVLRVWRQLPMWASAAVALVALGAPESGLLPGRAAASHRMYAAAVRMLSALLHGQSISKRDRVVWVGGPPRPRRWKAMFERQWRAI